MIDKALLKRFFEGETSFEEEQRVKNWMEQSGENQRLFFKERKLYDAVLFNPQFATKTSSNRQITYRNKQLYRALRVASILILALLTSVLIYTLKSNIYPPLALNTITVPPGQRVNLTLSDNTNVWLNSNTTFQYPSSFTNKNRMVYLNGEAFFDVTKNPKKPFIVSTQKANVKVFGTSFNVQAYSRSNVFEAALIEGKVEVVSNKNPNEVMLLSPNQKTVMKNGKLVMQDICDFDHYLWRKGLIAFKDKTLEEILNEFELYFDVKITIQNPNITKHTYTGKFRQTDGLDYALKVLQKGIRFNYERKEHLIIIK